MDEKALNFISLPYEYLADRKKEFGKNYTGKIVEMFTRLFKLDEKLGQKVGSIIEMLINSMFLIDDIEDDSTMRRGRPCAHLVFGTAATYNSGTYYSIKFIEQMMELCPKEKQPEALLEIIKLFKRSHEGQALDIFYRDNHVVPTEEEYRHMIDLKTTSTIYFCCRIMKILSDSEFELQPFCYLLGQYYQINDDYLNLTDNRFQEMKGFAEDLTEGKYSFPVVHALSQDTKDLTISNILRMRTQDMELKKLVIEKLNKLGSLEFTRKALNELKTKIVCELLRLDVAPELLKVFKQNTAEP